MSYADTTVDPELHVEHVRIARARIRKFQNSPRPLTAEACRNRADYTTSYRDRLVWLEAARILEGGDA